MLTGLLLLAMQTTDFQRTELPDGYDRITSATYQIDVPRGWKVSPETNFGQRKAYGPEGGNLGVMTAPPSNQDWDQLYRTALFFVLREKKGTASPYEVKKVKVANGEEREACVFGVKNEAGFEDRRYVMIKHPTQGLLALSVEIPNREVAKDWEKHFQRMVSSARFLGSSR